MIDWLIVGTDVMLRITETGAELQPKDVERIIDFSVQKVVAKINSGRGRAAIDHGRFHQLSASIDIRITPLQDAALTYFVLGDVLAGVWQYMCQPWSSFREIVFDILFRDAQGWGYIGYGRISKFLGVIAEVGNMSLSKDV